MKYRVVVFLVKVFAMTLLFNNVLAHPVADENDKSAKPVIIVAENAGDKDGGISVYRDLTGPTETKGIASLDSLGVIDLGGEFSVMEGRQMRARLFTIEPGGVIAIHTHNQRPGYAYIVSGTIIEHRNDTDGPITHSPGSIAKETTGISHWWENTSDQPVKALVVDIFSPE